VTHNPFGLRGGATRWGATRWVAPVGGVAALWLLGGATRVLTCGACVVRRWGATRRGATRWVAPVGGVAALWLLGGATRGAAQVQIRLGDPSRVTYSEIHDALREGTPAADSVLAIMGARSTKTLWPVVREAVEGTIEWNRGLLALNRIAELREPASGDSVLQWRRRIVNQEIPPPPATDLRDLLPGLRAVQLELMRKQRGDFALLRDLLQRIPEERYDLGDAWVFGRLGAGAADSVAARFMRETDRKLKARYLTLLSFSSDTALIPLLARVYAAPDSFDLPLRAGSRASDGLLWIGTRQSVEALLAARARARERGTYADPRLGHADLDFLGNDSSLVISRTGRWLTEWLDVLR
jgi:hypothetical protein